VFLSKTKLQLPDVTLVAVSGVNIKNTLYALWRSQLGIKFAKVIFITDAEINFTSKKIQIEHTDKEILNSIDAYSEYIVYRLHKHIYTKFALVVQADGYVLHPKKWTDDFFQYDYIGAPWRITNDAYIDPFGVHQRVGNGGFSLRSRKLLQTPNFSNVDWNVNENDFYNHMGVFSQSEDGIICIHNRHIYEQAGNKFAPLEIALKFSCEQKVDEYQGELTFGFHKQFPKKWERFFELLYRFIFQMRHRMI
jgi:hypothetical protein